MPTINPLIIPMKASLVYLSGVITETRAKINAMPKTVIRKRVEVAFIAIRAAAMKAVKAEAKADATMK